MKSTVDKTMDGTAFRGSRISAHSPVSLHARNKQRKDGQHFVKWNNVDFA